MGDLLLVLAQYYLCRGRTDKICTTSDDSNNIKGNLFLKHGLVSRTYSKKSLVMASIFGSKSKSFMTMSILSQDEPLTNRSVGDEVREKENLKPNETEYNDHDMTAKVEKRLRKKAKMSLRKRSKKKKRKRRT
ncbi:hypothetical protein Tco_1218268 [Tanacetum coccineum]